MGLSLLPFQTWQPLPHAFVDLLIAIPPVVEGVAPIDIGTDALLG